MLNDERTKVVPYVDVVDWQLERTNPDTFSRDSTLKIRAEDDAGASHPFVFEIKSEMLQLDLFLAARWRQELQTLIVQIVNEVLDARPEWHALNEELAPVVAEQEAARQSLRRLLATGFQLILPNSRSRAATRQCLLRAMRWRAGHDVKTGAFRRPF